MSRYCLDTSAYSFFYRGEARVVELMDTALWVGIPTVVLAELWIGFSRGGYVERNERELQMFLSDPLVEQINVDEQVARIYADIAIDLRRLGRPIPVNDMWVAACAIRHSATVLTFDAHFNAIRRAATIVLPAGI